LRARDAGAPEGARNPKQRDVRRCIVRLFQSSKRFPQEAFGGAWSAGLLTKGRNQKKCRDKAEKFDSQQYPHSQDKQNRPSFSEGFITPPNSSKRPRL